MKANYAISTIPLGQVVRNAADTSFEIKILCQLSLDGNLPTSTLQTAIDRHPILSLAAGTRLHGVVRRYTDWSAGRRSDETVLARCELTTRDPLGERRRALADLVGIGAIQPTVSKLTHSRDFDTLTSDDFVDVTAAMDGVRELTLGLHTIADASQNSSAQRLDSAASNSAMEQAKWLASCVQSAVLALVGGRAMTTDALQLESMLPARGLSRAVSSARAKIERRLRAEGVAKQTTTAETPRPDDINVLLQSSLKSELISRLCGFVTTWTAYCGSVLPDDEALVFELVLPEIGSDPDLHVGTVLPTAFFCGVHAHPAAYRDIVARRYRRSGFAWLSDNDAKPPAARYRATSIGAEHQFTKQILVQSSNTLGDAAEAPRDPQAFFRDPVDTRGPDQLSQDAAGLPEAQTTGVTFSAPVEDLVTPDQLRADSPEDRVDKLPCLFMEDLWIGYRLDVRAKDSTTFASTHSVQQSVHLKSGVVLDGFTEDQIDREQPQDPKYEYSSTDLKVYRGLSQPQGRDYLIAAGIESEELETPQNAFYTVSTLSTSSATPLTFGEQYDYQLRLVFAGGCSVRTDEKRDGGRYSQTFPFYRCASLQAGNVWISPEYRTVNGGIPETLFVSSARPRIEFALMPQHLDLESARFHGMLFCDRAEPSRLRNRRIIRDFTKAFPSQPNAIDYFCDPDVYGITITARILNGAEPAPYAGSEPVNGASCDLIQHQILGPLTELYGEPGQWETFRPIWITVIAREGRPPGFSHGGVFRGCRHVELSLPGAVHAELSFLPLYASGLEARHAANVASSAQLLSEKLATTPMLVPAVAMRIVRVTHAVGECRWPPRLEPMQRGGSRLPADGSLPTCIRTPDRPSVATVAANVSVDAPSSKQTWCEGNWLDIVDTSVQGRAYRMQPGNATSQGVNLVFEKKSPPPPSASQLKFAVDSSGKDIGPFDLQYVQSRVFLGQEQRPVGAKVDELTLPDERRRLLELRAVASPRFEDVSGVVSAGPAKSDPRRFDVPSALSMTPLQVAYAVPLKRALHDPSVRSAAFGMRIYLHPRMFESGPGERVAIGCWPEQTDGKALLEVPKYVTQWGEDPLARGKLVVTKRMPRASDFVLLQDDAKVGPQLDKSLYPIGVVGGTSGVIYRDAVALPPQGSAIPRLSLASFAVRYKPSECLWYFDVTIDAEFFGWCGLALYRHQPHSLEGFELAQTAAWVYSCTLYEEPFTVTRAGSELRVVVGPVYDKSVSFALDPTKFFNGVSADLEGANMQIVELSPRLIGNARYFEGQVATSSPNVSLVKMRAGYPVQSRPLVAQGGET
jgi:hypothetical protein